MTVPKIIRGLKRLKKWHIEQGAIRRRDMGKASKEHLDRAVLIGEAIEELERLRDLYK